MRAVLQRVSRAEVRVEGERVAGIDRGALALVAVENDDGEDEVARMAEKIRYLRYFEDEHEKMNLDLLEADGALLLVSQFTLAASTRKGRRPSFNDAARPDRARPMLDSLTERLRALGVDVETGHFGAAMEVELVNDGPVTLLIEV